MISEIDGTVPPIYRVIHISPLEVQVEPYSCRLRPSSGLVNGNVTFFSGDRLAGVHIHPRGAGINTFGIALLVGFSGKNGWKPGCFNPPF